ncbi:hypothetical protein G6F57_010923 [Rhizopus arrhizus]|uniref:Uncharacterized protein n=1 Tax=Rhizopus oryzae TaxID=64495 RepID=A0A9P6X0X4_RHIOR|nr:hypothetical protein G6F21_009133 [Rhizopus arrhizus]KAG1411248.1 hypothetical protein G6F58_008659 [Rhizopus delemar]KAG0791961.1 hypothetical protein G6F22_005996 [Rhizopus arrhizus]KAG0806482.1 hypothetical protein G6F20_011089 [Rhizopus arrhizus]KAG0823914.1 hypothetical protein G6F18_011096 [Rhizopus arrhizus]
MADAVCHVIKASPFKKAPGAGHLRIEMLQPVRQQQVPSLFSLFRICYTGSYTLISWIVAQVVPVHKKGSTSDPGIYRPTSLTPVFCQSYIPTNLHWILFKVVFVFTEVHEIKPFV